MADKPDLAVACFDGGFNCAQAILSTFGVEHGLGVEQALRLAGAFGAGMARQGETCGAVTGALMVIGLLYGKTRPEDDAARQKTYGLAQQFMDEFRARSGSTLCRQLLGYDLCSAEDYQKAREANVFQTACPGFVRSSAEILQNLLKEGKT